MPADTLKRCRLLRVRSKKGEYLSPEDIKFLESCWTGWPEEYKALDRPVFEEAAPFGSRAGSDAT